MIPAHDQALIERVLRAEGGFVNAPDDEGGATNRGITAATLGEWLGLPGPASAEQVRDLPESTAVAIYEEKWVRHPRLRLDLVQPLASAVVIMDTAVLFGRNRAALWAQAAAGLLPEERDGWLGPVSRHAIDQTPVELFALRVMALRARRHVDRCGEDRSQLGFLCGWLDRALHLPGVAV